MTKKTTLNPAVKKAASAACRSQTVGESIIQGLKEAITWATGGNESVQVTFIEVPRESTCDKSG